ncbi:phosphodiester glycosidase family protein [Amycolatopsis sp. 195334CR]|uniref:phosphodiester glycosidase family protein n=1 Tax=Amycolatopsis sp. 195334CR TaxID=2814588 RepID=UPI001A8F28EA|nr:phosphodiester glycosidase family protein [Amycolatopsis sp. 195334CR]MBN6037422.1 phosphodiester glycosidase family protein [Amycolatopsis sp. 195334CR]
MLAGLLAMPPVVAAADPLAAPLGPVPVEAAPSASSAGEPAVRAAAAVPDDGLVTDSATSEVAPGLSLTEFDRFDPLGWIRGDTLEVDLATGSLRPAYLNPGSVAARAPLSEQLAAAGAVAGVNGDFFDINATGAPLGVGIGDGQLHTAPAKGHNLTAAITAEGKARLASVFLDATITLPGGPVAATNFNGAVLPSNGIGVYTPLWGSASRKTSVAGAAKVLEVEVRDGVVSQLRPQPVDGPIAAGSTLLLARDAGVDALAGLAVGDPVSVAYAPRSDAGELAVAVGGNKVLLADGQLQPVDAAVMHPRTAVGFSADGSRMWLSTVDGRQADSRGMTELELARHMQSLGADDAINLDGGGSSTLLAREQGDVAASVRNSPSDGGERTVPNGLGFATAPGSGKLTGFAPHPEKETENADRVLPGLSRRLVAGAHDESGAAVPVKPIWRSARGVVRDGVFVATPGERATVEVEASYRGTRGSTELTVLGEPVRLGTSTEQVALSGTGVSGSFQVYGYDADGYGTWLEPADVQLEFDPAVVKVEPSGDRFAVTALVPAGATVVTAKAAGLVTHFVISVGSEAQALSPLDGPAGWTASVHPAVVGAALSEAPGRDGGRGLALDYRLTGTTATRAAYVNASTPYSLPAGTQKVGIWVNGDGKGAWLRAELRDASNVASIVDLTLAVDWTGWRYVEGSLPAGLPSGQRLTRFYAVENVPDQQYEGRLVFDDLTLKVAPSAEVPGDPVERDPAVLTDGSLGDGGLKVAVVSDAQFTADAPTGPLVAQARRTLREAVAAKPDVVVINGDFVDRGLAADFDLAHQIITEELDGRVPWYYVPGNHEADGGKGLTEFQAEFGAPQRVVDLNGVRMVLLDSSRGSLRAGGFDQVRMLREALDGAEADGAVRGVVVAMHHPTRDPSPTGNSQLADGKEADLLRTWLTAFEERSGKPAAAVASHAGVFTVSRVDGVPFLINGNAGKAPAAAPGDGGFTGWTLLRLDSEVTIQTRPHVDSLALTAPASLGIGTKAAVFGTVNQGGRAIPVAYPVSADWSGGTGTHVGSGPAGDAIATFDPATGLLTGLRPGTAELTLEVNGVRRTATISVTL